MTSSTYLFHTLISVGALSNISFSMACIVILAMTPEMLLPIGEAPNAECSQLILQCKQLVTQYSPRAKPVQLIWFVNAIDL